MINVLKSCIFRAMINCKHLKLNRSGQSAVEFMIVTLVVFFFLLFFLSLSFALVLSQYMDYATFMAARTYKAAHGDLPTQRDNAQKVFFAYADRVTATSLVRNVRLDFPNNNGVRAQYELSLFYLPPLFVDQPIPSRILLTSESFLGRDPNTDECFSFFESFASRLRLQMLGEGNDLTRQMEDNGC